MVDRPDGDNIAKLVLLDRFTLDQIYRTEAPRLTRYFRRQLRGGHEALDLVHEAFLRLAGSHPSVGHKHPAAYLQRIARNLLLDRVRQKATSGKARQVDVEEAFDIPVSGDQENAIVAAQLMSAYRRALAALPARTRDMFVLHRVDDLTYREIAERFGVTVPTVQYHVARALVHIDKALDQE